MCLQRRERALQCHCVAADPESGAGVGRWVYEVGTRLLSALVMVHLLLSSLGAPSCLFQQREDTNVSIPIQSIKSFFVSDSIVWGEKILVNFSEFGFPSPVQEGSHLVSDLGAPEGGV